MTNEGCPSIPSGNRNRWLFIASILVGGVAGGAVRVAVGHGPMADASGFFAMCAAMFPFARRSRLWHRLPTWRYWAAAAGGAVFAGGLRWLFDALAASAR